jgi:hypothetical protein
LASVASLPRDAERELLRCLEECSLKVDVYTGDRDPEEVVQFVFVDERSPVNIGDARNLYLRLDRQTEISEPVAFVNE